MAEMIKYYFPVILWFPYIPLGPAFDQERRWKGGWVPSLISYWNPNFFELYFKMFLFQGVLLVS